MNYKISANNHNRDIFPENPKKAYATMKVGDITDFSYVTINEETGYDEWSTPENIPGPLGFTSSNFSDNTFRGFGSDRYVFKAENKVLTNTEIVEQNASNVNGERITTNGINRTDTFVLYSDSSYDILSIRHIDP
jgi:hypothetical protein